MEEAEQWVPRFPDRGSSGVCSRGPMPCYTRVIECSCLGRDESEVNGGRAPDRRGGDVSGASGSFLGVEDSTLSRGPQTGISILVSLVSAA